MRRLIAGLLVLMLALAVPASALAAASKTHHKAARTGAKHAAAKKASGSKTKVTPTPAATTPSQSQLTPPNSSSPLAPGLPQNPASTPTATSPVVVPPAATTSTSSHDSGLSGTGIILVVIGALLIIAGVSWYIWHDSRKHTRRRHAAGAKTPQPRPSVPGSKRPPKARKLSPAEKKRRKRGRAR